MKYILVCDREHTPEMMEIEALDDAHAMEQFTALLVGHNAQKHPDLVLSSQDIADYITGHWTIGHLMEVKGT